jgi:arylsulfatase A-like enzyme
MTPSAALTWLRAGVVAALWLALLDAVALARAGAPAGAFVWLTLLAVALAVGALAPLALVALPLLSTRAAGAALGGLRRRPVARVAVAVVLVGGATALHLANGRLYVRLYLLLHLAMTAATLCLAQVGFAALWPARADAGRLAGGRGARLALAGGVVVWALALAVPLAQVLGSPVLRFLALERTTVASHGLLLLHQAWGVLDAPRAPDEAARAEAEALTTPTPLGAVSGRARGANLLLVTVDSMRVDRVPAGGAIERLEREGVVFTRAWAPSCWTIDSMAAVLTSRLPAQLRMTHVSMDTSLRLRAHDASDELVVNPANRKKVTPVPWDDPTPTLAGLLRGAGYVTATPVAYGFYRPEAGVTREFEHVDVAPWREHNLDNTGVTSAALTDAALAFLARRARARPFFLWIHYMDPHAPYLAQDAAAQGGDDLARYESELRLVDRELARLLDALAADGSLADTIVVVHADHGEEFRDHGGQFHATTAYDEVVRVPLVVRLPARAGVAATRLDAPVSLLDLAPTLVDLLGVPTDAGFVGRSLVPLLAGGALPPRPVLGACTRFGRDKRMVVAWPYKVIVDRAVGTAELYDLAADPGERENLVDRAGDDAARLWRLAVALP